MNIGRIHVDSRLVLAPMAGVTDLAFRQICRELGAGLTVTEMVSAKALCYQDRKTRSLLRLGPGEHPAGVQIFGSDAACMAELPRGYFQPGAFSAISEPSGVTSMAPVPAAVTCPITSTPSAKISCCFDSGTVNSSS